MVVKEMITEKMNAPVYVSSKRGCRDYIVIRYHNINNIVNDGAWM